MPKPALTENQRALLGYINTNKLGEGQRMDSGAFAKLMLHPEYVDLVRKNIESPEHWRKPGDSADFYDQFRSEVQNVSPISGEDVRPPQVRSSREGTYDTINTPALGDIPAHTRVEFRPSALQSFKDKLVEVRNAAGDAGAGIAGWVGGTKMPNRDDIASFLAGLTPATRAEKMGLYDRKLDAISGAAAKPKQTKLQKDGL